MYRLYIWCVTHFATLSEARAHMADLTDAAMAGQPASYARDGRNVAAVDADRLRNALSKLRPAQAQVFHENEAVGIALPEPALAVEGPDFNAAVAEMVIALREYAADWADHLRLAPNHDNAWGVVQLVALSSDAELADWVRGA
ncbi:MAG: prevent-host-death protein [Micropruina sp.]|nr:prevent-host-death protein [Micropruina sp.]